MSMFKTERDEDGFLLPAMRGTRRDEYGESWTHWAVYDRKQAEDDLASDDLAFTDEEAPFRLTGWFARETGPGRAFHSPPMLKVSRNRVLVKQHGGLDI